VSTAAERRDATAATLAIAALIAQQIAGKATRDALFLAAYDVRLLPYAVTGASLLSALAVVAFSGAMRRHAPARVVPASVALSGVVLVSLAAASPRVPALVALLLYAHMSFFGAVLISGFWSLVNERFDPHSARRLMGRIGTGASLGGVAGGVLAIAASRLLPVPAMLAVLGLLCMLAFASLRALAGSEAVRGPAGEAPGPLAGLGVLSGSRLLRSLALFVATAALVEALLDYVLAAGASARSRAGADLREFFALYHTGVAVLGLLCQAALGHRALQALGLAGTAALKPGAVALLGGLGAFAPGLSTAVAARGAAAVLHNSLFRSAYELFFTPVPAARKRPAKALIDVGADKLGAALGGALAATVVALAGEGATRVMFGAAAVASLGLVLLCRRLHDGYVRALADSLRSGAVRLEPDEVMDSTTLLTMTSMLPAADVALLQQRLRGARAEAGSAPTLVAVPDPMLRRIAELRGADVEAVRRALDSDELLGPELVPHVVPLLGRPDVYLETLRALRRAAPVVTGQLLDALLDPRTPLNVRRRLPRVLRHAGPLALPGLQLGLRAPEPGVRLECAAALARLYEREPGRAPTPEQSFALARRELQGWCGLDARDADVRLELLFHLLSPAIEPQPLRIALFALRTPGRLRGTALEYLENVLPDRLRLELLGALGEHEMERRVRRRPEELRTELVSGALELPAREVPTDDDD
jgi:AAA family ATP:ADP antiporter